MFNFLVWFAVRIIGNPSAKKKQQQTKTHFQDGGPSTSNKFHNEWYSI